MRKKRNKMEKTSPKEGDKDSSFWAEEGKKNKGRGK